jgi:signal transduction histidine kinase
LFPPKNIKISIEGKLPNLVTRKFKLHQVFQNLLSNSIKFNDKSEGNILVGCSEKVDHYEFYVKDNGSGLNKDDYKRIFNLHETTNKSSTRESSTGIGLNIVKVLVEEQGGQINVESIPGQGSTFYFQWLKI